MALTVKKISRLVAKGEPGMYLDEHGLYLVVGGKAAASWGLRFQLDGRARFMGLGSAADFSLAEARERAKKARQQLTDGIDPLEARRSERAARKATAASKLTFKEASLKFAAQRDREWTSGRHAAEVLRSLKTYAWPVIGSLDVAEIGMAHVLAVLEQRVAASQRSPAGVFWTARTVTADRVRNKIESVLSLCAARGHRPKGNNPAAWAGNLEFALASPTKAAPKQHFAAMPFAQVPQLVAELGRHAGVSPVGMKFLILTAARSGEVLGARWDEIEGMDSDNPMWVIPASRMKGRREHRVPLAPQAVKLLRELYREEANPHLFVGARQAALSAAAMGTFLRRLGHSETIHGFRSAFSDWAHERTSASNHVIEMSLAHAIGSEVERSYRRTDLFERRRKLMEAWAAFVTTAPKAQADVVPLRRRT